MNLNEIGVTIRAARKSRNLSQEALGKSLGMSRATISGIENGTIREVGIRKLINLCAALGLELDAFAQRRRPTLQELRRERDEARGA